MRLALTGGDRVALSIARAAALHPDHWLTRQVAASSADSLPLAVAGAQRCRSWEDLLADPEVDAVIVGDAGAEARQAVRQLLQAGKIVLFSPELLESAEFFYELALAETESPGRLFPLLALRAHPLVHELGQVLAREELGELRHVRLERQITASARAGASPLLSKSTVERALLHDADLLRALCGAYNQISASRAGDSAEGCSLATATLAGAGVPQVSWTAAATATAEAWRLTLSGDAGSALLAGDPQAGRLSLAIEARGERREFEERGDDPGEWLLEAFSQSRTEPSAGQAPQADAGSYWNELARSVELVEAFERSVRRRRTIDVHFESPSERGMFKTQMTAVGCSLLVFTLMGVVVYLVAAAAIAMPVMLKRVLVGLIFAPLGVFLVAQLLLFVARPGRDAGS